jgi:hypothetical protein
MVTFETLGFLAAVVVQVSAEVTAICYEGCSCTTTSDSTAGIINCTNVSLHGTPQGLPVDVCMVINNDEIPTIKKNSFSCPSASVYREMVLSLWKLERLLAFVTEFDHHTGAKYFPTAASCH